MNQFDIQTAALSNRRCWQIARKTLRVDPRCAQRDQLQLYVARLHDALDTIGDEYLNDPDTVEDNTNKHHGILLAVATPMIAGAYLAGYRQTSAILDQKVSPATVQLIQAEAQGRAGYMASTMTQTTRERAPVLSGDPDSDQELTQAFRGGYTFSKDRAKAATTYEMVKGYKAMVERSLRASGQSWGKWWEVSDAHEVQDDCDLNEDAGVIPIGQEFPSGDQQEPQHLFCQCSVFYTRMDL